MTASGTLTVRKVLTTALEFFYDAVFVVTDHMPPNYGDTQCFIADDSLGINNGKKTIVCSEGFALNLLTIATNERKQ